MSVLSQDWTTEKWADVVKALVRLLHKSAKKDARNIKICIEEVICKPAKTYISEDTAHTLQSLILALLESYIGLVRTNTVISLNRDELNEILISHWLVPNLKSCLSDIDEEIFNPKVTARCINSVIENYIESSPNWKDIRPSLSKDEIDRISYWKRGEHLPSTA